MTVPNLGRLPPPLATLAASWGGWRLQRRRYGHDLERRIDEILSRERWPEERWREWQEARLVEMLRHARRHVPHYRASFQGDDPPPELGSWPVLDKQTVRARSEALHASTQSANSLIRLHTSGSTGTPLELARDTTAERSWYALYEARTRRWNDVTRRDRWALFGGRLVVAAERSRPPFWIHNFAMHQLYCSSYHLSARTVAAYSEILRRFRPRYVVGYPSALATLARLALERSLELPAPRVVIANGELLSPGQRHLIESAFRAPVRNTYGMTEIVAAASECEEGSLHLWPEVGVLEVLDDQDRPVPAGTVGRLVATGLLNRAMPLVRYDTGDLGAIAPPGRSCPCGRTLPILERLTGRSDDVVITPDGREIGRLDPILKEDLPIHEAQIEQRAIDHVVVRVVPAQGYSPVTRKSLERALSDRMSGVHVEIEETDHIERGPNGKFPFVVSRLS